jgi:hypothetical protein
MREHKGISVSFAAFGVEVRSRGHDRLFLHLVVVRV